MNETAGIQVSPSGSYGSYFGNSVYSSANQCVYNGVSDSIGVTGLDNGKTYYFEIFTRRNSTWSNGEEVSGTPDFGGLTVSKMDSAYIIDFDSTLVGSNNGSFNGTGFSPSPGSGQLNSASWGIAGMSEGKCNFDSTKTSGDFARGTSSGGVGTGGIYAFQISTGNYSLGVQSVGDDFTPGEIICRIANETGATISHILIGYDLYINNDQFRSNSLNFSYSMDGQTFVEISTLNKISYDTSDSRGWRANPNIALITGLSLHDNSYFYLKWKGDEVSGSGSMDEFALDNISISLLSNAPDSIQISVQDSLESLAISGVDAVLMDTCVIGYIHLKNSILYLGINDLTVVDSLFSGSSSEYIETDSVGRLIKVIASPDSFTFPVGRSAFSPITLNFTASSAGHVGVRVVDRIHPNVDTSTATIDYIERFWQVSQTGLSSFNCNVTAIYDDGDIVGTEGNLFMGKWDGGPAWGVGNSVNASDNKLTMNGVTSFSDFTGAGSPVLPLKFLDVFIVNDVLHWLTASELNVNEFIIQVSFDGAHFNKIGSTKAWGNSTEKRTYSFDINTFKSMMYFRIVGVDYDGGKTFSPLAYRANNSNLVQITYLPDAVLLTSSNYTPKKITLFDNCGRNILSFSIDSELKIDRNSLRKGIYIINITEESGKIECYKFINY
jgi:hypothetical protein